MASSGNSLNVIIVGAGLGGLGAALSLAHDGHKVTVLDAAPEFGEAGAGIRVPPNSSRLLMRWGVDFSRIKKSTSERYHFISWKDGSTITQFPFGDAMKTYGAPYFLVHRADLHAGLLEAATKAGAIIKAGSKVVSFNWEEPSATVESGAVYKGDLIIAADGIKSIARPEILGRPDAPKDTGDVAYRILIPGDKLLADPELADLIKKPCTTSWCGPDAHIVGYPIRNGELYNIVVCATNFDEFENEGWIIKGDPTELCKRFSTWEPRVGKLCALVGSFMKWKLGDLDPLDRWVHPAGKAVLLGDSCHPMLPYLAQGAAQAIEDAAALRTCLRTNATLPEALKQYESIRLPRAARIQGKTREHQYILHIDDGPEQVERDEKMRNDAESNPVFWGQTERRDWLFGHDAEEAAQRAIAV